MIFNQEILYLGKILKKNKNNCIWAWLKGALTTNTVEHFLGSCFTIKQATQNSTQLGSYSNIKSQKEFSWILS